MPMSYNVFAFFNLIQLSSVKVVPALIPNICVCTAPATPIVHKSLLLPVLNCGDIALGGGDFTVVSIFPSVIILLFVVLSVTIDSALALVIVRENTNIVQINNFLNIDIFSRFYSIYLHKTLVFYCKYLVSWFRIFHVNKILTVTIICTKIITK